MNGNTLVKTMRTSELDVPRLAHMDPHAIRTPQFQILASIFGALFAHTMNQAMISAQRAVPASPNASSITASVAILQGLQQQQSEQLGQLAMQQHKAQEQKPMDDNAE